MVSLDSVDGYPEKVEGCGAEAYVYVLRLFSDRYYVGLTKQPKRRVISHARGEAVSPQWVRQYPPVAIASVLPFDSRERAAERETEVTLALARRYGPAKVRGAEWTDVDDRPPGGGDG